MSDGMSEAFKGTYFFDKSKTNKKGEKIHVPGTVKYVEIGIHYTGLGYSGESDGVEITGELIEFNQKHNSVILRDKDNFIHAVIPSTLEPIK